MAYRLGTDPLLFLASEGIERAIREAVALEAERTRQEEVRGFLDAIASMLGVKG